LRTWVSSGGGLPGPHEHHPKPHITQITTAKLLVSAAPVVADALDARDKGAGRS
jgi:hypothetical protein